MRIGFRADASAALGFGHVARIAALIEAAIARGDEPVAMLGLPARGEASSEAWSVTDVVAELDWLDAIVVDGPRLVDELVPELIARRVRTVVLDDRGGVVLPVDAIVNHNAHAPALADTYPAARRRLLGRRYLLLRHGITRLGRGACRPAATARLRVVVTFGGSDPVDATSRVVAAMPGERRLQLVAIAGPGYPFHDALARAAAVARTRGHDVEIHRAPDDIAALFAGADAAISAAGGTLGELAYLGVPAIGYAIVDDQVAPARELVRLGVIAGGATLAELSDAELRDQLARFFADDAARMQVRERALDTADGDGARRVLDEALG